MTEFPVGLGPFCADVGTIAEVSLLVRAGVVAGVFKHPTVGGAANVVVIGASLMTWAFVKFSVAVKYNYFLVTSLN